MRACDDSDKIRALTTGAPDAGQLAAEEGTTLASLVEVTIFVTGFYGVDELRRVLFRRYGEHLPASSHR